MWAFCRRYDPTMNPTPLIPLTDRALRPGEEDLLDRGPFVRNFVRILCRPPINESIVFALYGKWGEGKTTVLSLMEREFQARRSKGEPAPFVIHFNPWAFSGRNHVFKAFFEDVGNSIGRSPSPNPEETAKKWKRLGAYAGLAGNALSGLNEALNLVGAAIPLSKVFVSFLKKIDETASLADEAAGAGKEVTLQTLKAELVKDLENLKTPILVAVDDIDRLPPGEMVELLQVLKSTTDLPNVHYLLLYDREVIEQNLKTQDINPEYLGKIVQFSLPLPSVPESRLRSLLVDELAKIFQELAPKDARLNEEFWAELGRGSLPFAFSTLRDQKRFLGELRLTLPVFCSDGFFELNPEHFLKLQALRLFCPPLVDLIRNRRNLFVKRGLSYMFGLGDKKELVEKRKALVEDEIPRFLEDRGRLDLHQLCKELLRNYGTDLSETDLGKEMRFLASPLWFDCYFTLERPERAVSVAELSRLRASLLEPQESVDEAVKQVILRSGTAALVRCLQNHFRDETGKHGLTFLKSLLLKSGENDEELEIDEPWNPVLDFFVHWVWAIPPDSRESQLLELLAYTRNYGWFSQILLEIESGDGYTRRIAEDLRSVVPSVGKATADLIEEDARSGKLRLTPRFHYTQEGWERWGSTSRMARWVRSIMESDSGLRDYFCSLGVPQTVSADDGSEKQRLWVDHRRLIPIRNLGRIAKRIRHLKSSEAFRGESILWEGALEAIQVASEYQKGARHFKKAFPWLPKFRFFPASPSQFAYNPAAIILETLPDRPSSPRKGISKHSDAHELSKLLDDRGITSGTMMMGPIGEKEKVVGFLFPMESAKAIELGKALNRPFIFMIFNNERVEILSCEGKGRHYLGKLNDLVIPGSRESSNGD